MGLVKFYNSLPASLQQVILLAAVVAILVVANLTMANDPSWDDTRRGIVQGVLIRVLTLLGVTIEKKA